MFSHAIPCQGGETRAVGRGSEGCFWKGGCRERGIWLAMVAVTTLVTKAVEAEGGVEGFRRRVLSGLDACKINILWTLLLDDWNLSVWLMTYLLLAPHTVPASSTASLPLPLSLSSSRFATSHQQSSPPLFASHCAIFHFPPFQCWERAYWLDCLRFGAK